VILKADINHIRALVVDDNATNRSILQAQLQLWGVECVLVSSGSEALSRLSVTNMQLDGERFDVALLDMQMPGMDGETLARNIRTQSQLDGLHLVMMTSLQSRSAEQTMLDIGFSGWFSKPTSAPDLRDALQLLTHRRNTLEPAPLITVDYLRSFSRTDSRGVMTPIVNWPAQSRILLVEDNPINQEVGLGVLDSIGLRADVAGNGIEALASLNNAPLDRPYTAILMDCQMPEMDGFDATRNIRRGAAGEPNMGIKIIAMTADASHKIREKCLAAGMNDYLLKPIERTTVMKMLDDHLVKKSVESAADAAEQTDGVAENESTQTAVVLSCWDHAAALKIVRGKPERLVRIIGIFNTTAEPLVAQLNEAVISCDHGAMKFAAHSIKGIAMNLAAAQLQATAHLLEDAATKQADTDYARMYDDVQLAFSALTDELRSAYPKAFEEDTGQA
jgi:CheY-like chemotaxis protein